ncbi:C-type lectin domain family 4 member M-like isoform X1 [Hoplias malabaricus]|uniref:C-type lectin domain family 4 member M-like isoform X1 n=1 Tax=Hoplias malabaricus TaxID=27720 RepID=UPI003462BA23
MEINENEEATSSTAYNRLDSDNNLKNKWTTVYQQVKNLGTDIVRSRSYRLATLCLGLLCFLLLIVIIVLCTQSKHLSAQRDQLQMKNDNLTAEKDGLQTSFNKIATEKDMLQTKNNKLTAEKTQLQTSNDNMLTAKLQLQKSCNKLTAEKTQLQTNYSKLSKDKDQLQIRYSDLTKERDQLQISFGNVTKEMDELKKDKDRLTTENNDLKSDLIDLTLKKDHLKDNYTTLTIERDMLQTRLRNLTAEKDQLETIHTKLTTELNQLDSKYNSLTIERDQLKKEINESQKKLTDIEAYLKKGWLYFDSTLYFISNVKKTWLDSKKACTDQGANLAIINSKEEEDFLIKSLKGGRGWIGLIDKVTEGVWKWVDGSPLTTSYWCSGEPNDAGNEDCAEVLGIPGKNCWNDLPCSQTGGWICEKNLS